MRVAAHWAVLHGEPAGERDPMVEPGGEGTPAVREFCLPELAMARETHMVTTRNLVADVLDLQHRLPDTWVKVETLECEPWVARRVAALSRNVPAATIAVVDRAVAAAITGHAPGTVIALAEAMVIRADPEAHAMRREAERHRRYAALSRSDEFGYRKLIARVDAGDAVLLDAFLERIADILTARHGHDHNRDELRALALGWLARPVDLLQLLLEHTEPDDDLPDHDMPDDDMPDDDMPEGEDPDGGVRRPVWAPSHLERLLGRLAELSTRQLAALRGKATLFVHVDATSLAQQAGMVRVEGQGPMLVGSLVELLGHADVSLQPVIDLNQHVRVDRYEHHSSLKDQVWLQTSGDVFPFSPRTAVRDGVDFDHVAPYDPHGPPGQTGTHNSGPLRRRHHRWKTHGGYRCRQAGPGRHLWQTPHGLCFLVDHTGTHRLDPTTAEIILTAPPGVDIYVP